MTDQYLGEIRQVGFTFAPQGWAMCDGQLLPINQNQALFSLLGVNYGGDARTTFGLPDLRSRFPLHANNGSGGQGVSAIGVGEVVGSATVTLTTNQLPAHGHVPAAAGGVGDTNSPAGATWALAHVGRVADEIYAPAGAGSLQPMAAALDPAGGGQPHNNLPPFLVTNFIIALVGIYPPRG